MTSRNILSQAPQSMDERFEAAKRNNNYLREKPIDIRPPGEWKVKPRLMGGLKPHGVKVTIKKDF